MRLIAELSMPNCGSWNGRWSGERDRFTKEFSRSKKMADKIGRYSYNFGDGWRASVEIREAEPREKVTKKFCGYDWMIDSIKVRGEIVHRSDINALQTT